jgi:hypothetical protein
LPVTPRDWPRIVTKTLVREPPPVMLRPGVTLVRSATLTIFLATSCWLEKAVIETGTFEMSSARRRAVTTISAPMPLLSLFAVCAACPASWAHATSVITSDMAQADSARITLAFIVPSLFAARRFPGLRQFILKQNVTFATSFGLFARYRASANVRRSVLEIARNRESAWLLESG